jgi:hypothetical protein
MADETTPKNDASNTPAPEGGLTTPSTATSVHGLTVLSLGLPRLKRAAKSTTRATEVEKEYIFSHREVFGLKSLHEAAHAVGIAATSGSPSDPGDGGAWPGLRSVFGSRANAAHIVRIRSIDVTDRNSGHTHYTRGELGRSFNTAQDMAAMVVVALMGLAGERLYSTPTDLCSSDIRTATRLCSEIVAMGADLASVGSDGEPGSLMPATDSLSDRLTEEFKVESIRRLRIILDEAMAEALTICHLRQKEIVGLAEEVIAHNGRLSDQGVLDALKAVGMPIVSTLHVDDSDE